MDAERLRLDEDLRGLIEGDVLCDDLTVQMYGSDASIFQCSPLGVVRPRHREDVQAVVRYAAERKIPIIARGSGSGLAGESLGRGIVVDFSRYMRRVLAFADGCVTVQAGVVLETLNSRLAPLGRILGPDPANGDVTTIGGMIALDSSGSHWPAYGAMNSHVRELEVVLADGQVARLGRTHSVVPPPDDGASAAAPADRLARGVAEIVARHADALAARKVRSRVDRCGYRLHDICREGTVDLARLLVGGEGTLALVTEATLETSPLPQHVGSILLFFASLDAAAQAAEALSVLPLRACDLMDRRLLSVAREIDPRYELLIPAEAEAVLLVERAADNAAGLERGLLEVESHVVEKQGLATASHLAADPTDHELAWQLARRFSKTLHRLRGATRPVPYVEDVAVPPQSLREFLQLALDSLRRLQITASVFAHALHGQIHIRPFIDLADESERGKLKELAENLYEHVWQLGGTICGEHGEGFSRTPFAERQHGALAPAIREVKELFDPTGILNPGKKVPAEPPVEPEVRRFTVESPGVSADAAEAKQPAPAGGPQFVPLQLAWKADEMAYSARMCNGCAACRTQAKETRMCPIFRFAPREEASPRAKANLARSVLNGSLPPATLLDGACKEIADLCVHCHMCRLECPASVDIPKLMVEAKAEYAAVNGHPFDELVLSRIDAVCSYASRVSRLANWAIGNRPARWVLEKTLGIAQGRKLPRFNKRPYLSSPAQRRFSRLSRASGDKVLVFVDTFANYFDDQLLEALLAVLRHNGVASYVPERQASSGMPLIAAGAASQARVLAESNVALLAEGVRQGYAVVSTEPSAILALRREYLHLLGNDSDATLVSENSFDACQYLWQFHQRGKLQLNFRPLDLTVSYHMPCHLKALEVGAPGLNLMQLVPGLRVQHVERGCSGMAGMFGFSKRNYRASLRAGLPLMTELRNGGRQAGATECSTCRVQMEQGTDVPTIHPIKLLALAYGLMPELGERLRAPTEALVVR
jgi:FAD/FMN-containing dehydrogenase/Fe-S oxidoreductase